MASHRNVRNTLLVFSLLMLVLGTISFAIEYSTIRSSGRINYGDGVLFEDGFESGDFDSWTGVHTTYGDNVSVDTSEPYNGDYNCKSQVGGMESGVKSAYVHKSFSTGLSEIYVRGYFRIIDGLPLDDDGDRIVFMSFQVGTTTLCSFRIQHIGSGDIFDIAYYDGATTKSRYAEAVYPAEGKWYSIEFYVKLHSSEGAYRVWIDGIERITVTQVNSANWGQSIASLLLGLSYSVNVQHDVEIYTDSIVASSSYIGPLNLVVFTDGFETGDFGLWTGSYTDNYCDANVESYNPFNEKYYSDFVTTDSSAGIKQAYSYYMMPFTRNELYARVYTYIADGLPLDDSGDKFSVGVGFYSGSHPLANVRVIREAGTDKFGIVSSSWDQTVGEVFPQLGKWYCIELYWKIHPTEGAGRLWINGVEVLSRIGFDTTTSYGGIDQIVVGLYSIGIQHRIEILSDEVVVSTGYVGPYRYAFGIIGSELEIPSLRNFYWLLGNQSIKYRSLLPSEVTNYETIRHFDGLIVWTKPGSVYNITAIKRFAQTHAVIVHVWDFCNTLYPSLRSRVQIVSTKTVTYVKDWGNFRNGDLVEMRNETGDLDRLITVLASDLSSFGNVTQIARYDSNRVALFHMKGANSESGFYVMDLHATTPETEWIGIWHIFPAVKMVKDFPTGKYARWMANGQSWRDLTWIGDCINTIVMENGDIAQKWTIGKSVNGLNIPAIVIGKGSRYTIIDGSLHGNEKTTTFACLRIAELLLQYYRSSASWRTKLSQYKVIIIPVLNPDGFAANTRNNANGINLNRDFPPVGKASQPETRALMNLMGNYTPTIYVNNHEGYYWYPLDLWYSYYQIEPYTSFAKYAISLANDTFTALRHWGRFTEGGENVWIGYADRIQRSGLTNSAQAYAAWKHNTVTLLPESFIWSPTYGARQSLWGLDFYCSLSIALVEHYDFDKGFLFRSDGFITSSIVDSDSLTINLDTSELIYASTASIKDTTGRGEPATVYVDDVSKSEGDGWTYGSIVIVTGAKKSIEMIWTSSTS